MGKDEIGPFSCPPRGDTAGLGLMVFGKRPIAHVALSSGRPARRRLEVRMGKRPLPSTKSVVV